MILNYTGKNIEITPALKAHCDEKLQHLEQKFQKISNVYVIFTVEKNDQIAETTLHFHGTEINAKASTGDMYASIDAMVDKLSAQLTKFKEKLTDHH